MNTSYAYFGIGIVMLLALIAFTNPGLFGQRGDETIIVPLSPVATSSAFALSSSAFGEGTSIPSKYTCDATPAESQISPPLSIASPPVGTKTFAIIMEDPDVPKALKPDGTFLHWVLFNIPGNLTDLKEKTMEGLLGANGAGKNSYIGPCPPKEYQPVEHRYLFTLYALDTSLTLKVGASKQDMLKAMQGHILEQTALMGRYKKI